MKRTVDSVRVRFSTDQPCVYTCFETDNKLVRNVHYLKRCNLLLVVVYIVVSITASVCYGIVFGGTGVFLDFCDFIYL